MRRSIAIISFVVLLCLPLVGHSQDPFVLEDLHLVRWEQVPGGKPSYTGPVSAAILMAWYADRGYPELLPDLNRDGRIDAEDTVLLARDLGEEMQADLIDDRLADPFIVYPLARYIAERYPDEFRMLIFDPSFPEEVVRDLGQPFDPGEVPGILIEIHEDPRYETYRHHLEAWHPGIVGVGFDIPEWNDFTVSRSFMFHEAPDGWPVELVGTSERFAPEPVWETLMQLSPGRWGFLAPEWIPFEILIILMPADEPFGERGYPTDDPGDEPGDDPSGDPGGEPGDEPGGDRGDEPGDDPGGYPGPGDGPGGEPRIPSGSDEEGVCCLPDGSCDTTTADDCAQRGGSFVLNETCATHVCPRIGEELCSKVEGEITDICYTYESGVLTVYASYAIYNRSSIAARDITAYALVGLTDGTSGFGGPDGTDWRYGIDIPGGGTYTYDLVFSTNAPNLDLNKLSYLYGALWLQKEAPWDCWGILKQDYVQTWDPAPRCYPAGTPPGGSSDGDPIGVCCLPNGSCMMLNATDCDRVGGAFIASAPDCASVDCGKILVGECPKLSAEIVDICRSVAATGDVTIHMTVEIENSATVDAQTAELHANAGWGFTGPNQTLYGGPTDSWTGTVPAGQTLTKRFALDIGTAPDWATFHPWADAAAWIDDMPCDWRGDPIDSVAPDGSIPLCSRESEPTTPPGGSNEGRPGEPTGDSGACCLPDGSCENLEEQACVARDGLFYGPGTDCSEIRCFPAESPPCPVLRVNVLSACQLYRGADQPMIMKADVEIRNPGSSDAHNVAIGLVAGVGLLYDGMSPYRDSYQVTIPALPAGGSHRISRTFTIDPAPQQQPSQSAVWVVAKPSGALCSPGISPSQLYKHHIGAGQNICPDDGGTPPGGEGDVTGACCFTDGSCENLTSADCDRRGGEFYGEGTSCTSVDCGGGEPAGEPEPDPGPGAQPNLWVTGMTGCWSWSGGGQENVIATVTGIVHNGGQASASNVIARVTAGGHSKTVSVGTLAAGSQKTISATIDVGSYDQVTWPVQTSITADPGNTVSEADESNNTTNSSFPENSDCN